MAGKMLIVRLDKIPYTIVYSSQASISLPQVLNRLREFQTKFRTDNQAMEVFFSNNVSFNTENI